MTRLTCSFDSRVTPTICGIRQIVGPKTLCDLLLGNSRIRAIHDGKPTPSHHQRLVLML